MVSCLLVKFIDLIYKRLRRKFLRRFSFADLCNPPVSNVIG